MLQSSGGTESTGGTELRPLVVALYSTILSHRLLDGVTVSVPLTAGEYVKPAGLTPNAGAIYIVPGSAGRLNAMSTRGIHPAMRVSTMTLGSLVMDVNDTALVGTFITNTRTERDRFVIRKQAEYTLPERPPCVPTPSRRLRRLRG
jgi:hypothetical protein